MLTSYPPRTQTNKMRRPQDHGQDCSLPSGKAAVCSVFIAILCVWHERQRAPSNSTESRHIHHVMKLKQDLFELYLIMNMFNGEQRLNLTEGNQ